jgi:hypothetical protein
MGTDCACVLCVGCLYFARGWVALGSGFATFCLGNAHQVLA